MSILQLARSYLRKSLDEDRRQRIVRFQAHRLRGLQHLVYRGVIGSNLKALALVNNSDKWGNHWYVQHYEAHFARLRKKRLNVLEIGIGGYADPESGGSSLRMWRTYFPKSLIYGIDLFDKRAHDERRIKTFQGSQVDEEFLNGVVDSIGRLDIVIDDGSHCNDHVIRTFELLFPRLSEDGLYVIEDTQTSYWKSHGGSSQELNRADTSMGFFKRLCDGLNHAEFEIDDYRPTYYDQYITSIHFYHNLIFIQKGRNTEQSNRPWSVWKGVTQDV